MATTVRFTDGDDGWELFSEREVHKRLFTRLFGKPDRVRGIGATWVVPYGDLRITRRRTRGLTDQQRAANSARLAAMRSKKVAPDPNADHTTSDG